MKKSNNLNVSIFSILKASEKSGIPVLMLSNPGIGKTSTVYMFARVRGYEVVLLRGNSTSAEEVTGYDVSPKDVTWDHPMAACHLRPSWFETILRNKKDGKKTLLFLDELTTANEFVQSALLHLIFERKCGEEKLPDDTLIVSCGNYINNLSAGGNFNLLPPVMNRFCIFNIIPSLDDLDVFLNKYDGALVNENNIPTNYMKELEELLTRMDSEEKAVDDVLRNKIGEHIERSIRETTRLLMKSDGQVLDMKVTDLQNIYTALDYTDPKVYGFVTFRTLNYLRDISLAYYLCFGKNGISSNTFKLIIDGLCGIGLKLEKNKYGSEVRKTCIGEDYFDAINAAINDVEKMNVNKLPEYEQYFRSIIAQQTKDFDIPQIQAVTNKLLELKKDPELSKVERPIDGEIICSLCRQLVAFSEPLIKIKSSTVTPLSEIYTTSDAMIGVITKWNTIADYATELNRLALGKDNKYSESIMSVVKDNTEILCRTCSKMKAMRRFFIMSKAQEVEANLIPNVKDIIIR